MLREYGTGRGFGGSSMSRVDLHAVEVGALTPLLSRRRERTYANLRRLRLRLDSIRFLVA